MAPQVRTDRALVEGYGEGVGSVLSYRKGGNHPVQIGSVIGERYEVVDKLNGHPCGLEWLCRDKQTKNYVCLLVMKADVTSDHIELKYLKKNMRGIRLATDCFSIEGPNGTHRVVIYAPAGIPLTSDMRENTEKLKDLFIQISKTLATLHANGICHGYICPFTIKATINGLDGLSKDDVEKQVDEPFRRGVSQDSRDHEGLDITAPDYMVVPIDWLSLQQGPIHLSNGYVLTLATAYETLVPPKVLHHRPLFSPPEYLLKGTFGPETDVWAWGCTMFKARTGRYLFGGINEKDQQLFEMCLVLGKPPDAIWNEWQGRGEYFEDDNLTLTEEYRHVVNQPHSIRAIVEQGPTKYLSSDDYEPENLQGEEKEFFIDLMQSIFRWDSKERADMASIVKHPYLTES